MPPRDKATKLRAECGAMLDKALLQNAQLGLGGGQRGRRSSGSSHIYRPLPVVPRRTHTGGMKEK